MKGKYILGLIVSSLILLSSCVNLITVATEQSSLSERLRWGALITPLNISRDRVGNVLQCNGVWDCLEQMCKGEFVDPSVIYVAVRDFYLDVNNNTKCGWSMKRAFSWSLQFSAMKACIAFMVIVFVSELIGITVTLCNVRKWIMIMALILPMIWNVTAWVCYYIYLVRYTNASGDSAPNYILSWQLVTTFVTWIAMFSSRIGLIYYLANSTTYIRI